MRPSSRPIVACYYFPNYHADARNRALHGPGWMEWELVKCARPRFPGHAQPKVPAWGYTDEANPAHMEQKIAAAADHGIDAFIFDWYYYDDGPFLERGLEEGFFGAANRDRVKFCCMWANHDWKDIHPCGRTLGRATLFPGKVTPQTFETIVGKMVDEYFVHPSHLLVDGCPYFSIYDLTRFIENFGSLAATGRAVESFRKRVQAAGFPDLHLNAVVWGRTILPGEQLPVDPRGIVHDLGFDSATSYVWIHHAALEQSPLTPYDTVRERYFAHWDRMVKEYRMPYYPNVTMGWDSSPRTLPSDVWEPVGYPFMNSLGGNTPAAFRAALAATRDRLATTHPAAMLNINCWNEWTEGSYLEPDTATGMAYLEAVRDVFGRAGE